MPPSRLRALLPTGKLHVSLPPIGFLSRRLSPSLVGVALVAIATNLVLSLVGVEEAAAVTLKLGDILVADRQGPIIKIDPETGTQTVVNPLGITYASGIAVDADGKILVTSFVCDGCGGSFLPTVIRIDPVTGAQTVVTEGGFLNHPFGIAVEADGQILVTDDRNLIQIDPVTGDQAIFATGGSLQLGRGITIVRTKPKK
jgi:DNA-binding beta-propeller fold protein YncE